MNFTDIVDAIEQERARQEELWNRDHPWGTGDCSSPAVPMIVKAVVLGEECGEVMRAVLDLDAIGDLLGYLILYRIATRRTQLEDTP